jgi:hypothetical protein
MLREVFTDPEVSYLFLLLVPLMRKLLFSHVNKGKGGGLTGKFKKKENKIFSQKALKQIQQEIKDKVSSKLLDQKNDLIKLFKDELDNQ